MRAISPALVILAASFGACFHVGSAHAQAARTFVSSFGSDANDCSRATPCRTFQAAHDKTNDQGEITVLDPGGYGALTITKSISVVNDGVGEAGMLVSGGSTGIFVNAGGPSYVNLRGLTIQGIGFGGSIGLDLHQASFLTIENCVIRNHTSTGLSFFPVSNSSISVLNTLVSDNGGSGIILQSESTGVVVKAALQGVEIYNNSVHGLWAVANSPNSEVSAVITDSVAANNGGNGFYASAKAISQPNFAPTNVWVIHSVSANNSTGVASDGVDTGFLFLGDSVVTGNQVSWSRTNPAILESFVDNYIIGNFDGDPAPPIHIPLK